MGEEASYLKFVPVNDHFWQVKSAVTQAIADAIAPRHPGDVRIFVTDPTEEAIPLVRIFIDLVSDPYEVAISRNLPLRNEIIQAGKKAAIHFWARLQ